MQKVSTQLKVEKIKRNDESVQQNCTRLNICTIPNSLIAFNQRFYFHNRANKNPCYRLEVLTLYYIIADYFNLQYLENIKSKRKNVEVADHFWFLLDSYIA